MSSSGPPEANAIDEDSSGDPAGRLSGAARETAQSLFGASLPQSESYARLLAGDGVAHGLIGPREAGRLWDRHLLPAAVLGTVIPRAARVCDVGSGAGLPGLALALARPDLQVTLLEPMARRCVFLRRAVDVTGTSGRVTVRQARAEQVAADRPGFDVVTARAVARLPVLLDWLLPLSRPGGQVLAVKGSAVLAEVAEAADLLRGPRVDRWDVLELRVFDDGELPDDSDVVRLVRVVTAVNVSAPQPRSRAHRPRDRRRPTGRRAGRP